MGRKRIEKQQGEGKRHGIVSAPLAGIESALSATTSQLLLVLAVDLPEMDESLLPRLAADCSGDVGAVPLLL